MTERPMPDDQDRRKAVFLLLGIVLAGLVLRLIHFWALRDSAIPFRHLFVTTTDDYAFYQWARTILAGDWLGRATYHPYFQWMSDIAPLETWYRWWGGKEVFQQAPLYPYIFAAMLAVTRHDFPAILLIQLLLGALQPVVMYFLAKRLWNYRVGLIAALITAVYGPFVFHQGVLLRDWLAPILEPLALLAVAKALEQDSPRRWIVAGAALGVALLARETVQLLILLVLSWVVFSRRKDPGSAVRISGWLIAGLLLALSPLIVRNVVVGAPAFALSNRAAEGIIEGWAADGFPVGLFQPPSMKEILVASDGHLPGVIWGTIQTYGGNWMRLFEQVVTKLRGISDPFEFPNNISLYYGMEVSPVLRYMLGYWFVFPLGVAGLLLSLKTWKDHVVGVIFVMTAAGGLLAMVIFSRYRLELAAALILYAAVFCGHLIESLRQRRKQQFGLSLALAAGMSLSQQFLFPLGPDVKDYPYIVDYTASASVYGGIRRFDRAVEELDRGLKKISQYPYFNDPATLIWLRHFYLAHQLIEQGAVDAATQEAEIARETMLPHDYALLAMASLFLRLREFTRAGELLQAILDLDPNGPFAAEAGRLLAEMRNQEQADR